MMKKRLKIKTTKFFRDFLIIAMFLLRNNKFGHAKRKMRPAPSSPLFPAPFDPSPGPLRPFPGPSTPHITHSPLPPPSSRLAESKIRVFANLKKNASWTDRPTDGPTDGRTNGPTDGRTLL